MGRGNMRDSKKRAFNDDGELGTKLLLGCTPGVWVVCLKGVQPRAADTTATGPLFQQRPYPSLGRCCGRMLKFLHSPRNPARILQPYPRKWMGVMD